MAVASNLVAQEHNLVSVLLLEWGKKYMCVCVDFAMDGRLWRVA